MLAQAKSKRASHPEAWMRGFVVNLKEVEQARAQQLTRADSSGKSRREVWWMGDRSNT